MSITDILKEVPLSAVLRERIELEQSKAEFEVSQANARTQVAESRSVDLAAALENEKKEHQLTRQKLQEALNKISRLTSQPQPTPQIKMEFPGGPIRSL